MINRAHLSPLRYPGGKSSIAQYLGDLFIAQSPRGLLDIEIWMEPFAGGLGAGLKLLDAKIVDEVWFCEANPALASFWVNAATNHEELIGALKNLVGDTMTLPKYQRWREVLGDSTTNFSIPQAIAALVVNRCSRSGIVTPKASPIGGKSQSGKYTVNSRWNLDRTIKQIQKISAYGDSLRYLGNDGISQIASLPESGLAEEVFIFADPPYVSVGNSLYEMGMTFDDHLALAEALKGCGAHWALTYDNHPLVAEMYGKYEIAHFSMRHTVNRSKVGEEVMVYNLGTVSLPF